MRGPVGFSVLMMGLMPTQIGYQDLAALTALQPVMPQRARAPMLASPFGTIHLARFSLPQPIGTLIPEPPRVQLASLDARDVDVTGTIARHFASAAMLHRPRLDFPLVNRRLKGDLLVVRRREMPPPAEGTRDLTPGRVKTVSFPRPTDGLASGADYSVAPSRSEADVVTAALTPATALHTASASGEALARTASPAPSSGDLTEPESSKLAALSPSDHALPASAMAMQAPSDDAGSDAERLGRLYFRNIPLGEGVGTIQPWPSDEELLIEAPPANDPDIKKSALAPPSVDEVDFAAPEPLLPEQADAKIPSGAGQTVAPKGEVTGPDKRPKTPAERLGLNGKQRRKAEKCLADAVYFESRGEPKRGQIAVAQVVMNRVFSGFYPTDVCGVVYQNANRKFACQFTFACDNVPDVVDEPDMWAQAKQIARDMLDGKLWLPEIGHSTHYHAYWVHPSWVNEMRKVYKIGVHSFYRPRAWGDGSDIPPFNQSQTQADNAANKAKL